MYTVDSYDSKHINLSTRHYNLQVPVDDFKAFAGGWENHGVTTEEIDKFISVVQPERYQKNVETQEKLLAIIDHLQAEQENQNDEPCDDDYDFYDYEDEIDYGAFDYNDNEYPNFEQLYYDTRDELYDLNAKMRQIAYKVYSQKLDLSNYQNDKGIKFIIQQNRQNDNEYRFKFDPYGFVSNGHSDISSIFMLDNYNTVNGGWLKVIGNDVILYAKSGDYGVYDDIIATKCAKEVFTDKNVISFAGKMWHDVEDMLK